MLCSAALPVAGASAAPLTFGDTPRLGRVAMFSTSTAPGAVVDRFPGTDATGCGRGWEWAERFDVYRSGVRLGLSRGRVLDIATSRPGDRSPEGYRVGRARFAAVRRALRGDAALVGAGRFPVELRLGERVLQRQRRTGYESSMNYYYWFGANGRLSALQASPSGC